MRYESKTKDSKENYLNSVKSTKTCDCLVSDDCDTACTCAEDSEGYLFKKKTFEDQLKIVAEDVATLKELVQPREVNACLLMQLSDLIIALGKSKVDIDLNSRLKVKKEHVYYRDIKPLEDILRNKDGSC